MDTPSGTSLDELLDQLDHELKDREERERKSSGSDVYLNVYDMVNGVYVYVRVRVIIIHGVMHASRIVVDILKIELWLFFNYHPILVGLVK